MASLITPVLQLHAKTHFPIKLITTNFPIWQRQAIVGALLGSCTDTIQPLISNVSTARDAWLNLHSSFASASRGHVLALKSKLGKNPRGNRSINDYLHDMHSIANELALNQSPVAEEDLVAHILNQLGTEYDPISSAAFLRGSKLPFTELGDVLRDFERKLQVSDEVSAASIVATAHSTQRHSSTGPRGSHGNFGGSSGQRGFSSSGSSSHHNPSAGSFQQSRRRGGPSGSCQFCAIPGHDIKVCRKLSRLLRDHGLQTTSASGFGASPPVAHATTAHSDGLDDGSSHLPQWLLALLTEKFFNACIAHEGFKKNEKNVFCLDCSEAICSHCVHPPAHSLLQVRRYVYHDVIKLTDAEKLFDCSYVQAYTNNGAKVVFLKRRPLTRPCRARSGNPCLNCDRVLQIPHVFCSISCKLQHLLSRGVQLSELISVHDDGGGGDSPATEEWGGEDAAGRMTPVTVLEPLCSVKTDSGCSGSVDCRTPCCTATTEILPTTQILNHFPSSLIFFFSPILLSQHPQHKKAAILLLLLKKTRHPACTTVAVSRSCPPPHDGYSHRAIRRRLLRFPRAPIELPAGRQGDALAGNAAQERG
ncbi:unnamed protein product [Cuscuta campestris]|uniref:B box-type domain-containing protein n=1 Tax=Cuscuta campestris TaxID=132261 RepID=A0A484LHZ2_9ASTE|nr:unnamed protein product [Cuscuta campestris]